MANPIARWHAEHVNFSRLLDVFEEQITRFHEGEDPDVDLMLEIVSYLRSLGTAFTILARTPRSRALSCAIRHCGSQSIACCRSIAQSPLLAKSL